MLGRPSGRIVGMSDLYESPEQTPRMRSEGVPRSMTPLGSFGVRSVSMQNEDRDEAGKSEINVTPLIDVLLVLLIIFMVITPLLPRGLPADLPAKSTGNSPGEMPILLGMAANGQLSINNHPVSSDTLAAAIKELYSSRANKALFINADKNLQYRQVAQLIDRVKGVISDIQVELMP